MQHHVRAKVFFDRGGITHAKCDMCQILGKPRPWRGTEIHHIVNKGRTQNNEEARKLSEVPELLSLLCADCHTGSHNAHNPVAATKLLAFNAGKYGRDKVQAALDAVNSALRQPINLSLDEES